MMTSIKHNKCCLTIQKIMIMGALGPKVVENQEPIKHNNGALATQLGVENLTAYPTMYE